MTESKICTCPSGDGSLRHPCPAHPAVEQAGGDERAADEKPRATRCPDCGEHDLMPGDLCACGYETDPATGYACSECDGSGEGCVVEACRECDGSGWFVTPDQARAALAQPSPKCATCNDSGQIVVSGPHYQGEFQPPEYETEPCDMCAQPSPAQAEQAEAERPEVVARVVHSNPVVLGQCGPLNANDELMTVAQHAASVARWAEMFNRVEQERDAALTRVEQQERTIAGMNEAHATLAGLYEAAQAQHSVPEGYALIPVRETEAMHDAVMALLYKGVARTDTQKLLDAYIAAAPGKEVGHE